MSVIQLFLLSACLALSVARCPNGWDIRGDNCYKVFATAKTYDESKAACKAQGASLAGVADQVENNFLITKKEDAGLSQMWIGLYKDPAAPATCTNNNRACWRQDWKWEDGTTYNHNVFHDWQTEEPTNEEEVCARMTTTSQKHTIWAGMDCSAKYGYICKKTLWECEPGYALYRNSCYKRFTSTGWISWVDSRTACGNNGAYLVSIGDKAENDFVMSTFGVGDDNERSYFIGLSKCDGNNKDTCRGDWHWDNTNTPYTYTYWAEGQKQNTNWAQCSMVYYKSFYGTTLWYGISCDSHLYSYVCEKAAT